MEGHERRALTLQQMTFISELYFRDLVYGMGHDFCCLKVEFGVAGDKVAVAVEGEWCVSACALARASGTDGGRTYEASPTPVSQSCDRTRLALNWVSVCLGHDRVVLSGNVASLTCNKMNLASCEVQRYLCQAQLCLRRQAPSPSHCWGMGVSCTTRDLANLPKPCPITQPQLDENAPPGLP